MIVRDLMAEGPVLSVSEHDDMALASQIMLWASVRHLPVLGADGQVVGVLSENDILRYEAKAGMREGARAPVKAATSQPVELASPEDDLAEATARMIDRRIECLPVVERGELVGVLTSTDVLGHHARRRWPPGPPSPAGVTEVMTTPVATISEDDDLVTAAARMAQKGIRHLPVVDGEGRVIGMLSDRDVRRAAGDPAAVAEAAEQRAGAATVSALKVAHAMTAPPLLAREDELLAAVARHFLEWRVGALPVVNGEDRLLGIVSYVDVLRALYHHLYEARAGELGVASEDEAAAP